MSNQNGFQYIINWTGKDENGPTFQEGNYIFVEVPSASIVTLEIFTKNMGGTWNLDMVAQSQSYPQDFTYVRIKTQRSLKGPARLVCWAYSDSLGGGSITTDFTIF